MLQDMSNITPVKLTQHLSGCIQRYFQHNQILSIIVVTFNETFSLLIALYYSGN